MKIIIHHVQVKFHITNLIPAIKVINMIKDHAYITHLDWWLINIPNSLHLIFAYELAFCHQYTEQENNGKISSHMLLQ